MMTFLISLLMWGSAHALEAPIVGSYEAKVQIHRSWVRWEGPRAFIESDLVCERTLPLSLYDVRGRHHLRRYEKDLDMTCLSSLEGKPLEVNLTGKAEWLQPRDFSGWISGERDLLRVYFSLRLPGVDLPGRTQRLQEVSGQEILSEDLLTKSLIFRVSPPDLIGITCSQGACRNEGLPIVFRAHVELKKSLSFE